MTSTKANTYDSFQGVGKTDRESYRQSRALGLYEGLESHPNYGSNFILFITFISGQAAQEERPIGQEVEIV